MAIPLLICFILSTGCHKTTPIEFQPTLKLSPITVDQPILVKRIQGEKLKASLLVTYSHQKLDIKIVNDGQLPLTIGKLSFEIDQFENRKWRIMLFKNMKSVTDMGIRIDPGKSRLLKYEVGLPKGDYRCINPIFYTNMEFKLSQTFKV